MGLISDEKYSYRFECYTPEGKKISLEFDTENPCWSGVDGPMFNFFDFLKGCGYVFDINDSIGVMCADNTFRGAVEE